MEQFLCGQLFLMHTRVCALEGRLAALESEKAETATAEQEKVKALEERLTALEAEKVDREKAFTAFLYPEPEALDVGEPKAQEVGEPEEVEEPTTSVATQLYPCLEEERESQMQGEGAEELGSDDWPSAWEGEGEEETLVTESDEEEPPKKERRRRTT